MIYTVNITYQSCQANELMSGAMDRLGVGRPRGLVSGVCKSTPSLVVVKALSFPLYC